MAATGAREAQKLAAEHGQFIYIYGHVRTKQIIYSLTRAINNKAALRQLPYLGKQTVPRAIRKDFWRPLAIVTFPSGHQGLHAFRELREYRIRHEHEWTYEELGVKSRKQAGRKLRDQKGNSIADLAAVLARQEKIADNWTEEDSKEQDTQQRVVKEATEEYDKLKVEVRRLWKKVEQLNKAKVTNPEAPEANEKDIKLAMDEFRRVKTRKMLLQKRLNKPIPHLALRRIPDERNGQPPPPKRGTFKSRYLKEKPKISMDGVRIEWADLMDAEFAETWPKTVVHDEMGERRGSTRHSAPVPAALSEMRGVDETAGLEDTGRSSEIKLPLPESNEQAVERRSNKPDEHTSQHASMEPGSKTRMQRLVERLKFGAR